MAARTASVAISSVRGRNRVVAAAITGDTPT